MEIVKAGKQNVQKITELINFENNSQVTSSYLKSWYWEKPSGSSSVIILVDGEEVLGVSTSNNFDMLINGELKRAAFPQKVVTSQQVRGKGFFSKLYWTNEKDNYENEGVDINLTFTNHLSTPIFLKKFGYHEGVSPDVVILSPVLNRQSLEIIEHQDFESIQVNGFQFAHANSINKSLAYFKWRYSDEKALDKKGYGIFEIKRKGTVLGVVVVKKIKKKGIPVLALVDVLLKHSNDVNDIIQACRYMVLKQGSLGLMVLDNDFIHSSVETVKLKYVIKNQLNFLVKGRKEEETQVLSKTKFNFWFGDLDFI